MIRQIFNRCKYLLIDGESPEKTREQNISFLGQDKLVVHTDSSTVLDGRLVQQIEPLQCRKSFLMDLGRLFFGIDNSLEQEAEVLAIVDQWIAEAAIVERTARELVKKKIEFFLHNEAECELKLNDLSLTTLPDIWGYDPFSRRLVVLNISWNHLRVLPESLSLLNALREFSFFSNRSLACPESKKEEREVLVIIDQWIAESPEMERNARVIARRKIERFLYDEKERELKLRGLSLTKLPDIWHSNACVQRLSILDLCGNRLQNLPDSITKLAALQELDLSINGIQVLPARIGDLTNLTTLKLFRNELRSFPESIENLQILDYISFSHNRFTTVPKFILPRKTDSAVCSL